MDHEGFSDDLDLTICLHDVSYWDLKMTGQ